MGPILVIFNTNQVLFNGDSIKEKPIAGSETAVINMARELAKLNWEVYVFCPCDTPGVYDGVTYKHYTGIVEFMMKETVHTFISSRNTSPFTKSLGVKNAVYWSHDVPDESNIKALITAQENIDIMFFLSKAHTRVWLEQSLGKLDLNKAVITRNGVDEALFNVSNFKKVRGSCVYTTTPFRGLDILLKIWPIIKQKVPWATLQVYSSMGIYGLVDGYDTKRLFRVAREIKGVTLCKPVTQDKLAKIMLEADVMLYPNHFFETSCITAMESIKAKTPVITSDFGALPETILPDEGVLIPADPEHYEERFVQATVKMLTDKEYRLSFCHNNRDMSWELIAIEWDILFRGVN